MQRLRPQGWCAAPLARFVKRAAQAQHAPQCDLDPQQFLPWKVAATGLGARTFFLLVG